MTSELLNYTSLICRTQREIKIFEILAKTCFNLGYLIVRVKIFPKPDSYTLQLMVERTDDENITIGDCEIISKNCSVILDADDLTDDRYSLEISSTGFNRPLTRISDFEKHIGNSIILKTIQYVDGAKKFQGKLHEMKGNNIIIAGDSAAGEIFLRAFELENVYEAYLNNPFTNEDSSEDNKRRKSYSKKEGDTEFSEDIREERPMGSGGQRRSSGHSRNGYPRREGGERSGSSFGGGPRRDGERSGSSFGGGPRRDGGEGNSFRPRREGDSAGYPRRDGERSGSSFGGGPRRDGGEGNSFRPRREGDSAGYPRREGGERSGSSFGGGPRRDGERSGSSFGGGPRRDGERSGSSFGGGPRRDGERSGSSFGGGPRRDGERSGSSFGGGPRRDGERSGSSFGGGPRRDGERSGSSFGGGPRRDGERSGSSFGGGPRRDGGEGNSFRPRREGDSAGYPRREGERSGSSFGGGPRRDGERSGSSFGGGPRRDGGEGNNFRPRREGDSAGYPRRDGERSGSSFGGGPRRDGGEGNRKSFSKGPKKFNKN